MQLRYPIPSSKRRLVPIDQNFHRLSHFAIGLPGSPFKGDSEYQSQFYASPPQPSAIIRQYDPKTPTLPKLIGIKPEETNRNASPTPKFELIPIKTLKAPLGKNNKELLQISNAITPIRASRNEEIQSIMGTFSSAETTKNKLSIKKKFGSNITSLFGDISEQRRAKQQIVMDDIKHIEKIQSISKDIFKKQEEKSFERLQKQREELGKKEEYQAVQYKRVHK